MGAPRAVIAGLLLVVITAVAYVPAVRGGFVWDDDLYVTGNTLLRDPAGLGRIWLDPRTSVQYYPLSFTTFWIEYHLWESNPAGYHLTNILLQGLDAVLVWIVLRRLSIPGAWVAAALFAVHPVHVESVAWITERKNVLCGAFYLAAALAYLQYAGIGPQASVPSRPKRWYAAAMVLFACALLSKSVACTLPAALLLVLWWKRDRIAWRNVLPVIPLFAMGLAMALTTAWVEKTHVGAVGHEWGLSWVERCLVAGRITWFYLGKLIWPHPLIFVYPRWQVSAAVWWQYLYPATALGALLALWLARERVGKGPLAACLYFVGTLAPAMGFANVYYMQFSFVADHFQYLASFGPIALAVAAGAELAGRLGTRGRHGACVLAVCTVVLLGALTWRQTQVYADLETFWRDTLRKNPSADMAYNNLGGLLYNQGKLDEAINYLAEALRLKPTNPEAQNNLANAFLAQGKVGDAIQHYAEALRLDPAFAEAHNNLGGALLDQGKTAEACQHFTEALKLKPAFPEAHCNMGNALVRQNRLDDAVKSYNAALQLRPADAETHNSLGHALASQGNLNEALRHWTEALRLRPSYLVVYNNRAAAYYSLGQYDRAWADVKTCKKLGGTPDAELVRKLNKATGQAE